MGAVYLAHRADGEFDRQVALKLLKRGIDTDEILARFKAERRILARLDHPNIARLLDAGTTDDGLPYFVMEYVADGESLTAFARAHKLSVSARLELFRKVCAAVQFAHQSLVVHRDLKPGNILVTQEGEPKLLDFGIARLLEAADGTGAALHVTSVEQRRLTPAYASPEQLRGAAVTTSSDIYSLGALLYELLTDQLPHASDGDRRAPEFLRAPGQEDIRRPSLVAPDPETRRRLRGDLDNIVLRAMAYEPARRYLNASGLADDLQRHLTSRPVRARADTFGYRTAKFVRRNKLGVTAGVLLALALAGGVATTAWEARRAQRRFNDVRRLTNSYLFEIHDAIHYLPGSTAARQLIVNRALEYLDRLAREGGGDRTLQLDLVEAYLKVGDVQGKPYSANLGDSAGALRSYEKAIEISAPLVASERTRSSGVRRVLAQAYESRGGVESRLHHWKNAMSSHEQAIAIREQLLKSNPKQAIEWQRGIVSDYIGLGDATVNANRFQPAAGYQQVALQHYRNALPLCERLVAAAPRDEALNRLLAKTCSRVATVLSEIGESGHDAAAFRESSQLHLRAVALDEAALRANPSNAVLRRGLADELIALGYLRAFSGEDLPSALEDCRRAREIMENLAASDPANTEARQDLSSAHYVTARVLQAQGNLPAAAESYRQSLSILEPLVADHPDNVETSFDLARVRKGLSEVSGIGP